MGGPMTMRIREAAISRSYMRGGSCLTLLWMQAHSAIEGNWNENYKALFISGFGEEWQAAHQVLQEREALRMYGENAPEILKIADEVVHVSD